MARPIIICGRGPRKLPIFVTELVIGELNWRESNNSPQKKTEAPRKRRPVDLRSRPKAKNRHELKVKRANSPMTGSAVRVKLPKARAGTCSWSANGVDHPCHATATATMA